LSDLDELLRLAVGVQFDEREVLEHLPPRDEVLYSLEILTEKEHLFVGASIEAAACGVPISECLLNALVLTRARWSSMPVRESFRVPLLRSL
jgi:hypothetical protein